MDEAVDTWVTNAGMMVMVRRQVHVVEVADAGQLVEFLQSRDPDQFAHERVVTLL
jgi:hypothetical protein